MEFCELKELLKTAADKAGLTEYEIYYSKENSISTRQAAVTPRGP